MIAIDMDQTMSAHLVLLNKFFVLSENMLSLYVAQSQTSVIV